MQETPLVTVLCSCYNHGQFVAESLTSVLNQTYTNIQLIVIDDFSIDNSVAVIDTFIKKFPQITFIKNKQNLGITTSVNSAARLAKGEFIIDLAADDILLPHCVALQIEKFKENCFENLAIVYGNAELVTENGTHLSYYFDVDATLKTIQKRPKGNLYLDIISPEVTICSVSGMMKKTVFDALKGYDDSLAYEDFDYWIRVSRNYNIDFIDAVLVQKRILSNSLHASFSAPKNKTAASTYIILKKAFSLNRNKKEYFALRKRVNFEIINNYRTGNYFLMIQNCLLRFRIFMKTI
jgi:glycosyltransferase involved in cell wall biosynthesis